MDDIVCLVCIAYQCQLFLACSSDMGERNLASQLISRRQDDKQAGVVTEKFSGLRVK